MYEKLKEICIANIPIKFPNGDFNEIYQKRLEYELEIISAMGYSNYHLPSKHVS